MSSMKSCPSSSFLRIFSYRVRDVSLVIEFVLQNQYLAVQVKDLLEIDVFFPIGIRRALRAALLINATTLEMAICYV